jgi:hypothetical protein
MGCSCLAKLLAEMPAIAEVPRDTTNWARLELTLEQYFPPRAFHRRLKGDEKKKQGGEGGGGVKRRMIRGEPLKMIASFGTQTVNGCVGPVMRDSASGITWYFKGIR